MCIKKILGLSILLILFSSIFVLAQDSYKEKGTIKPIIYTNGEEIPEAVIKALEEHSVKLQQAKQNKTIEKEKEDKNIIYNFLSFFAKLFGILTVLIIAFIGIKKIFIKFKEGPIRWKNKF